MEKYTNDEISIINANEPINNINNSLVDSIVKKMLHNKEYESLLNFYNTLYDFSILDLSEISDNLIKGNEFECIAFFLNNEDVLYFLPSEEKKKLKNFLNVKEISIKLNEPYNYYKDLLFKQGFIIFPSDIKKINDNIKEYRITKGNRRCDFALKEIKNIGLFVSYINYYNYNLPIEEQKLRGIDYINQYGFNIDKKAKSISIEY